MIQSSHYPTLQAESAIIVPHQVQVGYPVRTVGHNAHSLSTLASPGLDLITVPRVGEEDDWADHQFGVAAAQQPLTSVPHTVSLGQRIKRGRHLGHIRHPCISSGQDLTNERHGRVNASDR